MNVNIRLHVMRMQSAMILMGATGVSVSQDSPEMDTTVQVCGTLVIKYYYFTFCHLQISMSVKHRMILALMRMLIVLILWGTTAVSAIQDSLEMVTTVQVLQYYMTA